MVDELAPLHHHHGELLRVGLGGRVDRVADRAGARQLLVALPHRHRRPELTRPIVPTEARFTCLGHTELCKNIPVKFCESFRMFHCPPKNGKPAISETWQEGYSVMSAISG